MIVSTAIIPIFDYVGYKFGAILENWYEIDSTFTIIGIFLVIGVGGLTVYSKIHKYINMPGDTTKVNNKSNNDSIINYPQIEVTLDQVRIAVREYSEKLPKGVFRTILVQDDNSIDFEKLTPYLGGIPYKNFYMSKETYDLFEENEKLIPIEMDMVQKAVDQYVKDHKEYPMLSFDPLHRVNYYLLLQEHYLKKAPKTQFYITDLDGLITHITPQNKNSSQL
ncbi:DUF3939 domain-containing protein [Neobacillus cucumis]|uniref:DUF3939 domain-containing protein n=1 Tax=Neobacillus cucumis TaxID=1740721 RepID=UPI00203FD636|nr:DUF3939 domain-containing protein [Neobacillus cucumis]MCM3725554.1 DUF3939 domain-containing protein [Neobacillus cucumis]